MTSPEDLGAQTGLLARGLSGRRRTGARLSIGRGSTFWTDLDYVYVPWPLPGEVSAETRALALAVALQCAPSKEVAMRIVIKHPYPRLAVALRLAEAQAALGWALDQWPGLRSSANEVTGGLAPEEWRGLTPAELARRAQVLVGSRAEIPPVCGRLLLRESTGGRLRRAAQRLSLRIPRKLDDRLVALGGRFSIEIEVFDAEADQHDSSVSTAIDADTAAWRPNSLEGIPYPEWDYSIGALRPNWVTVIPATAAPGTERPGPPRHDLESWFVAPLDRRWRGRLTDGPDLDIDGVVEALTNLATGHGSVDRVYRDRLKTDRDLVYAILLDASGSLSQAALIRHELDLADALVGAMDRARERHAVYAFHSQGRHGVHVETLQAFGEPARRPSASAVKPRGQTRLGAALRHVTAELSREPATRRALVVLSDCVPFDELYEGAYAEADVAKAVEEAEDDGIVVAILGVDDREDGPLDDVLGDRLQRVGDPDRLTEALARVHGLLSA